MKDEHVDRPSWLWSVGRIFCRMIGSRYFNLHALGARHVPKTGGVLLVSNHQSYLDPVMIALPLKREVSYLARASLFDNPLFGWLIRRLNAVPIERGAADVGAMKEAIRRLREGRALVIFVEGTRSRDGEIQPLRAGVGLVARRAGVPVVPVVIDGSLRAWPRGQTLPRSHPIRVLYGPALKLDDLDANEVVARIETTLKTMLSDLRDGQVGEYR